MSPPWKVLQTQEVQEWLTEAPPSLRRAVDKKIALLSLYGPQLSRPHVDHIKEIEMTKFTNFYDAPTIKALYADENYEKDSEVDFDDLFHETTSYWINNVRRRKKFTQQHLADLMHISQPGICQMLKRPATIAKLFRLCAAMGGTLEVNVRFGDEVISLLYGDKKPEETSTK